ncbi:MAG: hypothetical protein LEGION0398_MBIBDBAK_00307 [Legionellaceae bacterium]
MGFFQRAKKTVKPFINVYQWVDVDSLKQGGNIITKLLKNLFIPSQSTYRESFEMAIARLNLTEKDIQDRIKQFTLYVRLFLGIFFLICLYLIYLMYHHAFMAFFASLGLMLFVLGQAFRYHFWVYQMKKRKLSCQFSEWFKDSFMR